MQSSIESIWKEGFLESNALVAPKLNDLYNRKSIHFVEKFKRRLRFNHYFIIGLAIVSLAIGYDMGGAYLSLFMGIIFIPIVHVSNKSLKGMNRLDYSSSSYQYLVSFDGWLKSAIVNFTRIFRYFYALFFSAIFGGLWLSKSEAILRKLPDAYMIGGVPAILIAGFVIVIVLMVIFGEAIYKFDLKLMYRGMFKKLENMIAEMEELRGNN